MDTLGQITLELSLVRSSGNYWLRVSMVESVSLDKPVAHRPTLCRSFQITATAYAAVDNARLGGLYWRSLCKPQTAHARNLPLIKQHQQQRATLRSESKLMYCQNHAAIVMVGTSRGYSCEKTSFVNRVDYDCNCRQR